MGRPGPQPPERSAPRWGQGTGTVRSGRWHSALSCRGGEGGGLLGSELALATGPSRPHSKSLVSGDEFQPRPQRAAHLPPGQRRACHICLSAAGYCSPGLVASRVAGQAEDGEEGAQFWSALGEDGGWGDLPRHGQRRAAVQMPAAWAFCCWAPGVRASCRWGCLWQKGRCEAARCHPGWAALGGAGVGGDQPARLRHHEKSQDGTGCLHVHREGSG